MVRALFLLIGIAVFVYLLIQLGPAAVLAMLARIDGRRCRSRSPTRRSRRCARWRCRFGHERRGAPRPRCAVDPPVRRSGPVPYVHRTILAEPAKAMLLKGRGLKATEGFAATLTEYLSYTFTAAALSISALWWILAHGMVSGGARTALLVILCVMEDRTITSAP
jgi:hypothetical protein